MKHNSIIILISVILLGSCYFWEADKEKFIEVYTEILVIRVQVPDSLEAARKIGKVLDEHGYTYESWEKDFEYFYSDPKEFMAIMDTIRERSRRKITELTQKVIEKDSTDNAESKTFTENVD